MSDVESTRRESVMDDPRARSVAQLYAESLLSAAAERSAAVLEELQSFVHEVLGAYPELRSLLVNASIHRNAKISMIDRVAAPQVSELCANFLRVLARHERLELLETVLHCAELELERRSGRQRVRVVSAAKLDAASLERIQGRLRTVFSFEPILEEEQDPTLIGGLVIQIGNSVYDGSLRSRLGQLAKRMQQRSLHEIQSGRDRFSHPEGN